jgi:hypothetical protein
MEESRLGSDRTVFEPLSPGAKSSRTWKPFAAAPSVADMGELHDPVNAAATGGMQTYCHRGSLNQSSAVRRDSTKFTPNLHQGAYEIYTKCMTGNKITRKINGRGDRI